jgi:hypothetical protein
VWPSSAGLSTASTREGFTVLGWQQAGLSFWAVSDLNATELKEFREDLTERAPR